MLSILCVSNMKPRALPLVEEMRAAASLLSAEFVLVRDGVDVHSAGYIESVLDEAVGLTRGEYVLRLDDDEKISPAMMRWLETREYEMAQHWSFPRVHLWGNPRTALLERYYYPDLQTRLSTREKSGGRTEIHAASPHGAGRVAPCAIEHWVYLVKSYEERLETSRRYLTIKYGADGGKYRAGAIEDDKKDGPIKFIEYTDGAVPLRGHTWTGKL